MVVCFRGVRKEIGEKKSAFACPLAFVLIIDLADWPTLVTA